MVAQDSWTQKANFIGNRQGTIHFSIGNKGYIGTGTDDVAYKNDFWEYDPVTDLWTQKADYGGGIRAYATSFTIGNMGYAGTGAAGSYIWRKDMWEYNPASNSWRRVADFGTGLPDALGGGFRYTAVSFGIGNKGYMGTGNYRISPAYLATYLNDFWEFDPLVGDSGTWTRMADVPEQGRCNAFGLSIGNKGYIGNGIYYYDTIQEDIWEYDPTTNIWTRKVNLPGPGRVSAATFSIANKGYVAGGAGYGGFYNDLWEYTPSSNSWIQKANLPGSVRYLEAGFNIANKGYIGLGGNSTGSLNDFWEYSPDGIPNPVIKFDPISVTTYAGNGEAGFTDGSALTSKFNSPTGVISDANGNVYIADQANNRIRKITASGLVSTIAGNGTAGFADGMGMDAQFNGPRGLTLDLSGNILVADENNHRIRKITPAGMVSTLAGNGTGGFADGEGSAAQFNFPQGVTTDTEGNVYVADKYNQRIRKITPTGFVSTIAGNGSEFPLDGYGTDAQFLTPNGLAFDGLGNLFITQFYSNLRKMNTLGYVSTISTNPTTYNTFHQGVVVDSQGYVYISIENNMTQNMIYRISPAGTGGIVAGTFRGYQDGIGTAAKFEGLAGLCIDNSGNLYITDPGNNRIRKMSTPTLDFSTIAGTASAARLFSISGTYLYSNLTITAPDGYEISQNINNGYVSTINLSPTLGEINLSTIYIRLKADNLVGTYNSNITISSSGATTKYLAVTGKVIVPVVKFDPIFVSTAAGNGEAGFADGISTTAKFNNPTGVATDVSGNIFVADRLNHRIRKITPAGMVTTFAGSGVAGLLDGMGTAAQFASPNSLTMDAAGNLYVCDGSNGRIRKITPSGLVSTINGINGTAQFSAPSGVAIDASGNIYVAEIYNHRIQKIAADGTVSIFAGSGVIGDDDGIGTAAQFWNPNNLTVDIYGNLYVTELYGGPRKITASGVVTSIRPSDLYGFHYGIALDAAANVFVSLIFGGDDSHIYKITTGGASGFVAGGTKGYQDGLAADAKFNGAYGLTFDVPGNLYVADADNNRIRKITPPVLNFSTHAGTASASQFFSISGTNLTGNISLTAPASYEISRTESSGYSSTLGVSPTLGEINSVIIYIRLKANIGAGNYNSNINLAATGAISQVLPVTGIVIDTIPPVVQCPPAQLFCFNASNNYAVPVITATDISGIKNIRYAITGATSRNGTGPNASGLFNPGRNTILWTVTDNAGNIKTCTTIVRIDFPLSVSIPNVYPLLIWGKVNTIYKGFGPTCAILFASPSGGTQYPYSRYRYQWSTGATTQVINVCPGTVGLNMFTVTITDSLGCKATASIGINVVDVRCGPNNNEVLVCWFGRYQNCYTQGQAITALLLGAKLGSCSANLTASANKSIGDLEDVIVSNDKEIELYPNPNNGSFTLRLHNPDVSEIRISDQSGRIVYRELVKGINKSKTIFVNPGMLARGIYLVQAINKNGISTCKMIVQ